MNPEPLGEISQLNKCKHGSYGLCVKCRYLNTGRRKSTDSFVEADVVEFISSNMNKRFNLTNQDKGE
jgi:hypothetical protein